MFSKPISLLLVYILSAVNFAILLFPLAIITLPIITLSDQDLGKNASYFFMVTMFITSSLMLFYLFLDFLFGFSIRSLLKGCVNHKKSEDYGFLSDLFNEVKSRFEVGNVQLYIKESDEVNAFAIASFTKKYVVITTGLLNSFADDCSNEQAFAHNEKAVSAAFQSSVKGIIGHEISHLINKDFLPGLLLNINERATYFVSQIISFILNIFIRIFSLIPIIGSPFAFIFTKIYALSNWVITFFHKYIIYNVYSFARKFLSRSIEYRCDRQSAQAVSGTNMALALSFLGEGGFFTIFSTHPKTSSRIKKVEDIPEKSVKIRASLITRLSNALSLLVLIFTCLIYGQKADIKGLYNNYQSNVSAINTKINDTRNKIQRNYNKILQNTR